jgi:hypothetical protein
MAKIEAIYKKDLFQRNAGILPAMSAKAQKPGWHILKLI